MPMKYTHDGDADLYQRKFQQPDKAGPFAFNLDVGFVHAPGFSRWLLAALRLCRKKRRKLDHPTVQRPMINVNAALLHDFLEITVGTRVAQIEEHGVQDRFFWEMYALEVNHRSAPLVRHLCRKITAASRDPAKVKKVCDRTLAFAPDKARSDATPDRVSQT
jgi:hypothetical protein